MAQMASTVDIVRGADLPVLALNSISKAFGGVQALSSVSLEVASAEVHAVVGENGAGKSTLMKIIAGALQPDSGSVAFLGQLVRFRTPRDASRAGIAIVYQEPSVFADLSVLENFYMGDELLGPGRKLDWKGMTAAAAAALEQVGLPGSLVGKRMADLSLGTQQLVLIARGVHKQARLLILDEPTSILSQTETDTLFRVISELKARGVSILYISHRLAEIYQIADRITVLRDGKVAGHFTVAEATDDNLLMAMSGREISMAVYKPRPLEGKAPVLEVHGLGRAGLYRDVSFSLRPCEVLGMYGLVGAGRTEVAQTIYGELQADEGEIILEGKPIRPNNSREAVRLGINYVPEDRRTQGLFLPRAVRDNISAGILPSITGLLGVLNRQRETLLAGEQITRFRIKTDRPQTPVGNLSGGSQQKVVLARWLVKTPKVLLLDEPTRGIDVGTKAEIHRLIMALAEQGVAILMISSDLPEVLGLADNIVVMHEGSLAGYLTRQEATEASVLRLTLGLGTETQTVAET